MFSQAWRYMPVMDLGTREAEAMRSASVQNKCGSYQGLMSNKTKQNKTDKNEGKGERKEERRKYVFTWKLNL